MSNYIYDPIKLDFEDTSSLDVSHMFGRRVNVQVSVLDPEDSSQYVMCFPKIEHLSSDVVRISFFEGEIATPKTGFVIVN